MKSVHKYLKVFIFVQLGACVGRTLHQYLDFVKRPELYASYSAPWYTSLFLTWILTAVMVVMMLIAYFVVGHIIQKNEQSKTESPCNVK